MATDESDVTRLEALAGLSLTADERRRLAGDLQRLLAFVGELPVQVAADPATAGGPLRPDTPADAVLARDSVALRDGWFTVPPLREGEAPEGGDVA